MSSQEIALASCRLGNFFYYVKRITKKAKMPKYVNTYGIKLTDIQNMMFKKYLSNQAIAMNTKTPKERRQIIIDFLKSKFIRRS